MTRAFESSADARAEPIRDLHPPFGPRPHPGQLIRQSLVLAAKTLEGASAAHEIREVILIHDDGIERPVRPPFRPAIPHSDKEMRPRGRCGEELDVAEIERLDHGQRHHVLQRVPYGPRRFEVRDQGDGQR